MKKVTVYIDNEKIKVPEGATVMEAAEHIGIRIPRLCYHPDLSVEGACRVCIVEVEGMQKYATACTDKVHEGMRIRTASPEIRRARRDIVELILDNHPKECQTCERDGHCELQHLAYSLGVRNRHYEGNRKQHDKESSSASVIRDAEKCILCKRCVRVCAEIQGINNLSQLHRGVKTVVAPAFEGPMAESICINCGQCINVCPVAAFLEKPHTRKVWNALSDPKKHVVVQVAPAIRAAIGEGFNYPPGTACTGKTVTALRRLGFHQVFDTNFAADLTIVEEANELVHRLEKNENLPLLTSCSPGWIKFVEHFYPELIPNTSTCKSPMQMLSTMAKTYYAQMKGIDPKDIYMVAIMPCVAKKFEAERPEHLTEDGYPYTDAVLTTRELIWMIKAYGIDFTKLPDSEFDAPLGFSSGAADIFGTTGGVMEAALRTAAEKITGKPIAKLEFKQVRAVEGLREATLQIGGQEIRVAVANGLGNAKIILEKIRTGEAAYHLVEIMACPGGCIGGGGQPYPPKGYHILDKEVNRLRAQALYTIDEAKAVRKSHENPFITKLYDEFLKEPGSPLAHKLLHTTYGPREPKGIK